MVTPSDQSQPSTLQYGSQSFAGKLTTNLKQQLEETTERAQVTIISPFRSLAGPTYIGVQVRDKYARAPPDAQERAFAREDEG